MRTGLGLFVACIAFAFPLPPTLCRAGSTITPANRVQTRATPDGTGTCWYACADTIGRHTGLGLAGVQDRLLATGAYRDGGWSITPEARAFWAGASQVRMEVVRDRDADWLGKKIHAASVPVIVSLRPLVDASGRTLRGEHAVVVTRIEGSTVYLIDTSAGAAEQAWDWAVFWRHWTGFAWAFEALDSQGELTAGR